MNLTLPAATLKSLLAPADRVVERRTTIPVLACLRLEAAAGRVTVTATDLDIQLTTAAPAAVARAGVVCVPAAPLRDWVAKAPAGAEIRIEHDAAAARITVSAGRARMTLGTLPAEDFPEFTAGRGERPVAAWAWTAATWGAVVAPVAFAVSTEETRYYLNGVFFHVTGDRLAAVATDGHRLARMTVTAPGAAPDLAAIVPRKTVELIGRCAAAAEPETPLDLQVGASVITARLGDGLVVTSKLVDGTFPEYERVIPPPPQHRAVVDRALLAAAVDRVALMADGTSHGIRLEIAPEAEGRATLRLSAGGRDAPGTAAETLDVAWSGGMIAAGYNGKYLAEILGHVAGPTVALAPTDAGSPALITPADPPIDGPDQTIVLMPMRVE